MLSENKEHVPRLARFHQRLDKVKASNFLRKLAVTVWPHTCLLCRGVSELRLDVCRACYRELPWLRHHMALYRHAVWHYAPPISGMIAALKFGHQWPYARVLGTMMGHYLSKAYRSRSVPEVIIPVPLHINRMRARGFNQSVLLARYIHTVFPIPIDTRLAIRVRDTPFQRLLSHQKRLLSVQEAFEVRNQGVRRQHVLLVDDVLTTGATVRALVCALKVAGVKRVDVLVGAKVMKKGVVQSSVQ